MKAMKNHYSFMLPGITSLAIIVLFILSTSISAQSFEGKTFKGEAKSDNSGRVWPATLKITSHDERSGEFTGDITWHSLSSINKIEGLIRGNTIIFKEVEYIKKGGAVLNCEYAFVIHKDKLIGTWTDLQSDYGSAKFE